MNTDSLRRIIADEATEGTEEEGIVGGISSITGRGRDKITKNGYMLSA